MHPILFELGHFKLHTYGALMGAGFLVGMQLILRRALKLSIRETQVNQLIMLAFLFGILGARLLFVMIDNPLGYLTDPLEIFKIWKGGLVFFGGFLSATLAMAIYAKRQQLAVLKVFDLCTPALVLAHAMGRLGCFMAGCCYGKICHLPWAVTFRHPEGVGLKNLPLHPTQIYEAVFLTTLYFILLGLRRWQRFDGMLFMVYLALYGVGRSIIELFRNDMRGQLWGLSTAQWISLPVVLVAITAIAYKIYRKSSEPLTT